MKRISLLVALLAIQATVQAQDTTYDWTGTGGFTGIITLDSPSSTDGRLSDIVSAYVMDPDGYGPFATYSVPLTYSWGMFSSTAYPLDVTDATLSGLFTWDASQITTMSIVWNPVGDDFVYFDAGAAVDDSVGYVNTDVPLTEWDNSGNWLAQADSVPDAASTALLLGAVLAGLGGMLIARPKLAPVKCKEPRRMKNRRHS